MHTANVTEWGQAPIYLEVDTPPAPVDPSHIQIKVVAAGVHRVVRSRAAGKHYSVKSLPHTPGTDGVGTASDGQMVYFSTFATGGSFSEIINVPSSAVTPLPEGIDPYQAAGFINPALSSWMALKKRTDRLPSGFTVLVMGATSASGDVAVSVSRCLGAGRVIGCARNAQALSSLGLDEAIVLQPNVDATDFTKATDVDVILDYMYGPPTEHLLRSVAFSRPVQYVHIGSVAGSDMSLPGSILRSKNLTIRGSGPGSWSHADMDIELPFLLEAFRDIKPKALEKVPLRDVEKAWNSSSGKRLVVVMHS